MNQNVEAIGSFTMIISVFIIVGWVIISAFNYSLKKRLIELGQINEASLKFISRPVESRLQDVKWGLLFFFAGLGLVILEFIPYSGSESPLPYGIEFVFISIGFFVYYLIAQQQKNKIDRLA